MPYKSSFDQRRAARAHYDAHRGDYIARAKAHNKRQRLRIKACIRAAKDVPCTDCGVRYPFYVMQFDHLRDKLFDIGTAATTGTMTLKKLRREIAKCEVVCANCHAERTHQRGQRFAAGAGEVVAGEDAQVALF